MDEGEDMKCRKWQPPLDDSRAWMGTCEKTGCDCHIHTAEKRNCNIIPKRKAKVVRVKALAEGLIDRKQFVVVATSRNPKPKYHGFSAPCTIVFTAANWRKLKGGK